MRNRFGLLLPAVLILGLLLAQGASAVKPWWGLHTGSRPAYIKPDTSQNEIQELSVTTEEFLNPEDAFFELSVGSTELGVFATEPLASMFSFKALTAAALQSALEGVYGAGNVSVSEASAPAGSLKFRIESIGADAGKSVLPLTVSPIIGKVKMLSDAQLYVSVENLGDASLAGTKSPVKITDILPPGLSAVGVAGSIPGKNGSYNGRRPLPCALEEAGARVSCTFTEALPAYSELELRIAVVTRGASSGEQNEVSVSGGEGFLCSQVGSGSGSFTDGGCTVPGSGSFERSPLGPVAPASIHRAITLSSEPIPFGVEQYALENEEEGGAPATQAGTHPFQQTTSIALNQGADIGALGTTPHINPVALPKDLHFRWPAGLIGNPNAFPQCTDEQFFHIIESGGANLCSPQSAVGIADVTINEPNILGVTEIPVPLFNLKPHVGEPARFGFNVTLGNTPVVIDTSVRTGGDYGVTVSVDNITQITGFLSSEVTVWGVPGDPRHDRQRGWSCLLEANGSTLRPRSEGGIGPCQGATEQHPPPFLSLPTSCTGPLHSTVEGDAWSSPGPFKELADDEMPGLDGCNRLPFSAAIKVAPDGQQASTPTGLTVDVHVPQQEDLNGAGLASSNIKDIRVLLSEGVSLNPAAADGLQSCSEEQIGYLPAQSSPPGELHFTEKLPEPLSQGQNFCPDASKVGTVRIKTPLLPNPLEGAVYLAAPAPNGEEGQNPFRTLVAMYIVAKDPVSGALVKLPGRVVLDQATGRIEGVFENTPQLAFEDAELHFFGGNRAPLVTPARCGAYTTVARFTPWSGSPPITSSSSFQITSGPNGGPCPGAGLAFGPALTAGMININAGSFSPLTTTIGREDGQQDIQSVQLRMPPGLSGILSGVLLCSEAQANAGTCPEASKIGETIVSVGLGGDPFTVTGGKVYLTERYQGAPFGLSIVNPAKAGPFDLGKVVVRARIEVDPHTAALTVTTDQTGPYAIPHILDGIPLQIKHVNVTIDRPGFTFNPTSCDPTAITGTIGSDEGASSPVSVPFQVTNCASLKFAPKFAVSTSGKNSKANGASLTVKLSEPGEPQGAQANIAKVKVELPKQLPSRLTTLQKACTAAQFAANPAGCPAASIIGHAIVHTPLLPVQLEGPAYFVSNGGEAFPNLIMVLQGYGVRVDLVGDTFISKAGITSSTFKTVPDVPFSTFELTLPQGPNSALATNVPAKANYSLCGQKLSMPTEFVGQNGATFSRSTPVGVTGCAKARALTRAQKLTRALKACHQKKSKGKRRACERAVRKRYGTVKRRKV